MQLFVLCYQVRTYLNSFWFFLLTKIILFWFGDLSFLDILFPLLCRSSWDGGTYDVHHCISDDSHCGPQRLEASVMGLRLVICVSAALGSI